MNQPFAIGWTRPASDIGGTDLGALDLPVEFDRGSQRSPCRTGRVLRATELLVQPAR